MDDFEPESTIKIAPINKNEYLNIIYSIIPTYLFVYNTNMDILNNLGEKPCVSNYIGFFDEDFIIDINAFNVRVKNYLKKEGLSDAYYARKKEINIIGAKWFDLAFSFHDKIFLPIVSMGLENVVNKDKGNSIYLNYGYLDSIKSPWIVDDVNVSEKHYFSNEKINFFPKFPNDAIYFKMNLADDLRGHINGLDSDVVIEDILAENGWDKSFVSSLFSDIPYFVVNFFGRGANYLSKYVNDQIVSNDFVDNLVDTDEIIDLFINYKINKNINF
ncbi:hypothetical protein K9L67_03075 [Candidatus Woesearchaeota archaeon]|nr:hypothetical protein [Candidatus Woesearchaeota archaeon]MCF7901184.1 hypothetical protein [Candidatus Woesearchaeota archaeon]MCF8012858.1 hypothetical protein [Candidatus Woesearchaeota archaeon]